MPSTMAKVTRTTTGTSTPGQPTSVMDVPARYSTWSKYRRSGELAPLISAETSAPSSCAARTSASSSLR